MDMGGIDLVHGQPQAAGEPVFDAPWQARAFAMAVHMNERGLFEWQEWADRLSSRISQYEQTEDIDGSDAYYRLWLDTLETFAQELSLNSHE
jgi:nitrile hydratase accessory protein